MKRRTLALAFVASLAAGALATGGLLFLLLQSGPKTTSVKPASNPEGMASVGKQLYITKGCLACHSTDGTPMQGETWLGLYGRTIPLADGRDAVVDDDFLRRSIRDPSAEIHAGYPATMPRQTLQDHEIEALVAYIKSLAGE